MAWQDEINTFVNKPKSGESGAEAAPKKSALQTGYSRTPMEDVPAHPGHPGDGIPGKNNMGDSSYRSPSQAEADADAKRMAKEQRDRDAAQ